MTKTLTREHYIWCSDLCHFVFVSVHPVYAWVVYIEQPVLDAQWFNMNMFCSCKHTKWSYLAYTIRWVLTGQLNNTFSINRRFYAWHPSQTYMQLYKLNNNIVFIMLTINSTPTGQHTLIFKVLSIVLQNITPFLLIVDSQMIKSTLVLWINRFTNSPSKVVKCGSDTASQARWGSGSNSVMRT